MDLDFGFEIGGLGFGFGKQLRHSKVGQSRAEREQSETKQGENVQNRTEQNRVQIG